MAIVVVAAAINHGTSIDVPRHRVGDRILIYAFNRNSTTIPVNVSHFLGSTITTSGNSTSFLIRSLLSGPGSAPGFTAGPYTNATAVCYVILRSTDPERYAVCIAGGLNSNSSAANTDITYNAVTPADTAVTYRFLLFGAHVNNNGTISNPISGATVLAASNGSGGGIAVHLTNTLAASFAGATQTIGATSGPTRAARFPLFECPVYPGGLLPGDFSLGLLMSEISNRNRVMNTDQADFRNLDTRRQRGQYYLEIHCSVQTAAASSIVYYRVFGNHDPGVFIEYRADGSSTMTGVATGVTLETLSAGDTVCIAIDSVLKKVWFRKNAGNWNNSGSDDPVTGAGGFSMSGSFQYINVGSGTRAVTVAHHLRERFADFAYAVPSGYNEFYEPPYLDPQFFRMLL